MRKTLGAYWSSLNGRRTNSCGSELDADDLRLTVTTMLVNTNDAFTGLNAANVSNMAVGDIKTFMTVTWDAGTEANTETATMRGPAAGAAGGGGEAAGYDVVRDDLADAVRLHQGVVTSANAEIQAVRTCLHRY